MFPFPPSDVPGQGGGPEESGVSIGAPKPESDTPRAPATVRGRRGGTFKYVLSPSNTRSTERFVLTDRDPKQDRGSAQRFVKDSRGLRACVTRDMNVWGRGTDLLSRPYSRRRRNEGPWKKVTCVAKNNSLIAYAVRVTRTRGT